MALRPACDVFLTAVEGVKKYVVVVQEVSSETIVGTEVKLINATPLACVDLCPRALERLEGKIITGTTPPVKRDGVATLQREQEAAANERKKEAAPGEAALAK